MQSALLRGGAALAEEVSFTQVLAFAMERHLRLIEREDTCDAHQDCIDLQAGPIISPFLDVHFDRVVLGHVQLPNTPYAALPPNVAHSLSGGRFDDDDRSRQPVAAGIARNSRRLMCETGSRSSIMRFQCSNHWPTLRQ